MDAARITPRRYGGKTADQRRAERRATLIEAALAIWEEQGWAAVTMRGVCAHAGLTDRYFYESFADRDALLATVWDQMRDETLKMALDTITPLQDRPPLEQLRAAQVAVMHHIADEPARAQIIFGDHAGSAVLEQRRRDMLQLSTDLMIQLARPYLRADLDERAFRVTVLIGMGGFTELVLAWQSGLVDSDADSLVEHLMGVAASLATPFLRPETLAGR